MTHNAVLRIEINNKKPVELADFTASMAAFADAFKQYASENTMDPLPDNMRLYVKSMQDGSIIAEMVALTEQAQFIYEHAKVLAGFVGNLHDLINFFLGRERSLPQPAEPTAREAKQVASIVEPIAKDSAAQMNIVLNGDVHLHHHITIDSVQANAIQNAAARYGLKKLPSAIIAPDQLLVLEQVKNSAKSGSGDRGIIEAISPRPVKLQFASEDIKRQILNLYENPFQLIFQVDIEVRSVDGKPAMYRILQVIDTISRD